MAASQSVRDESPPSQHDSLNVSSVEPLATRLDRCARGTHRMHVLGYVRHGSVAGVDCSRPLRWVCRDCGDFDIRPCKNHRSSKCKPCALRYRSKVRRVALSGINRQTGHQYFLTATAPSDPHCMRPGCSRHPGECGHAACPCGVEGFDLARWNAAHSSMWNRFRTALRRLYPDLEFMRGVEVQEGDHRSDRAGRGALHDHAMMWASVPIPPATVKALLVAAGFGHSFDLPEVAPGSKRAAYYVAKYVTKAADSRAEVPWWGEVVDYETGEVSEGLVDGRYRTWSMSRGWGLTMAAVEEQCRVYARARAAEALWLGMGDAARSLGASWELSDPPIGSPPSP
uniref:Uncharacterized protein n=1 Tax=uncultured prokaryote TaxID=198431 RepID=A0A0H5QJA4_9ZZZZ|nr:hypothetical protein [uncultured prokaryote]